MEILYTKYIHKFKFKYSKNPAQIAIGGNGNGLYANSDDGEGFEQAIFNVTLLLILSVCLQQIQRNTST